MAFIPVPKTAVVALRFALAGQQVVNTLSFEGTAVWTPTTLEGICGQMENWWNANMAPILSVDLVMTEIYALSLENDSAPSFTFTDVSGNSGQVAEASVANNVAISVTLRTALRGRSYRGRNYIAGIPITAQVDSVHVSTGFRDDVVDAYTALITGVPYSNSSVPVVVSRQHNKVELSTGVTTPVTSADANTDYDSMRRRLRGRGI